MHAAAGGNITFSGVITTSGGTSGIVNGGPGGDVSIVTTGGNVTVTDITANGANGVGGGGEIYLQPANGFHLGGLGNALPNGTIFFNGTTLSTIGGGGITPGEGGLVALAPLGRTIDERRYDVR